MTEECPYCKKPISEKSKKCDLCGYELTKTRKTIVMFQYEIDKSIGAIRGLNLYAAFIILSSIGMGIFTIISSTVTIGEFSYTNRWLIFIGIIQIVVGILMSLVFFGVAGVLHFLLRHVVQLSKKINQ